MNAPSARAASLLRRRKAVPAQREAGSAGVESDLVVIPAWVPAASLVARCRAGGAYPVVEADGLVVGILELATLVGRSDLDDQLAGQLCVPCSAAHALAARLVLENGRLVGARPNGLRSAS